MSKKNKEKMFRVMDYAPHDGPVVIDYFDDYNTACKSLEKGQWVEGKINDEWYGLA